MRTPVIAFLVTTVFAAAGCHHSKPPAIAPTRAAAASTAPTAPPAPPRPPSPAPAPPHTPTPDELFQRESLTDLNAAHPLGDAFFDYNQTTLRDDARRALQQDAEWLAKWPTTKVMVEGHCDERGTAEYNLGLGDRRAKQVETYLESLGVSPSRIVTESLGKEKPFCAGSGESCWSENRRGHFVITAK